MDTTTNHATDGDETVHPHRPDPHTPDTLLPSPLVHTLIAPAGDEDKSSDDSTKQPSPSQLADLRYRQALAESAELDAASKRRTNANIVASDWENRTYMFFSGTSNDPIKKAIEDLSVMSRRFPGEALTIVLNSPGGSVTAGLALYDHIRALSASGHHMTVVVRGMAASMGGILLQSGDERVVGEEAEVLIHAVSAGTEGPLYTMEDSVEYFKRLWTKLSKILARRSQLTDKQVRARCARKDWWFDAKTAVELGFADRIG